MTLSPHALRKLEDPFAALARNLLKATRNRRMVFMQNDGNFGDALIRYGTLKFFEDLKLQFTEFDMGWKRDKLGCLVNDLWDRLRNKYLFVYSCSGAWSKATNLGYRNIRWQRRLTKNLFVLPTTFDKHRMKLDFPAYARDQFQSKAFIRNKPFCHDMAFYLALIDPRRVLADRRRPKKKIGLMLRTDNESTGFRMKGLHQNFDLSATGSHKNDPQDFLHYIDQFEHIITDRLHVAVGGILLKKKVTILGGNYFKIKAIYNSSIAGIFDNVEFIEHPSEDVLRQYALLSLQEGNEYISGFGDESRPYKQQHS